MPRLYDVTGGRVTIDGVDVRDLTSSKLRSLVATAFEEPTLFSMSARENLTLGRADATEDEIAEALDVAQADFVRDLPWGLDTRIGEQGMSLSGGQRQRLALARAVLAQPRVLVLDDTLSALDVHTEKLVEEALRRVLADTTGLIVAHRASTVLLADRVALLQDGTITHVGEHRELLATVPAYRELLAADSDADLEGCVVIDDHADRPRQRRGAASPPTAIGRRGHDRARPRAGSATAARAGCSGPAARPTHARSWLLLIVVIENAARLSIPYLVKEGIDTGIPPIRESNNLEPLLLIVGIVLVADDHPGGRPATCSWSAPGRSARTSSSQIRRGCSATSSGSARPSTTTTRRAGSSPARPPTSTPSTRCSRPASTGWSPPR